MSVTGSGSDAESTARSTFAYLLLTHKEPHQVEELADRILDLSANAQIVVHHDLAADGLPWEGRPPAPIYLVDRGRVRWGDWSMVDATLRLLRFAVEQLDTEWFALLSGDHRPAVDLGPWEAETARSGVDVYASAEQLPDRLRFGTKDFEASQYLARSRHRWTAYPQPGSALLHRAMGALARGCRGLHPLVAMEYVHRQEAWVVGRRRRLDCMGGRTFFRGSQWILLNRRAAEAALSVDPAVTAWFKRSWIPDEAYFHTALRHTPGLVVSNTPTTYVLEDPERPTPDWRRLTLQDLPAVWASGAPFARKVDPSIRPEVAAALDRAVDERRTSDMTDSARRLPDRSVPSRPAGAGS
jgi:hypothetical protein